MAERWDGIGQHHGRGALDQGRAPASPAVVGGADCVRLPVFLWVRFPCAVPTGAYFRRTAWTLLLPGWLRLLQGWGP